MCGPISGSDYKEKCAVKTCCCGCTLRTGSLIIGWLKLIASAIWIILFIIGVIAVHQAGYYYSGWTYVPIINIILSLVAGILILIGVYKQNAKVFWAAVYIELILIIWSLIFLIIYFCLRSTHLGIAGLVGFLIDINFVIVLRSYGYEIAAGSGEIA